MWKHDPANMGAHKIDIMRHIPVGKKLIGGFTFMALVTLVAGMACVYAIWSLNENARRISETRMPALTSLLRLQQSLAEIKAAQRTLLISGIQDAIRDRQTALLQEAQAKFPAASAELEKLLDRGNERASWDTIKKSIAALHEANAPFLEAAKASDLPRMTELAFGTCRERLVQAQTQMDAMVKEVHGAVQAEAREDQGKSRTMFWGLLAGILVGSFLTLMLGLNVAWDSVRPLRKLVSFSKTVAAGNLEEKLKITRRDDYGILAESLRVMVANLKAKITEAGEKSVQADEEARKAKEATDQALAAKTEAESAAANIREAAVRLEKVVEVVNAASGELTAQVKLASQGAATQSSRVAETAAAMTEMNATVLEVARNAALAVESAESARVRAGEGSQVVAQVVEGITAMQQVSVRLQEDMSRLREQSESIGQVLEVISDIADQTNLLALNAAIEAARAGEAGRGFAVVADEVRKLAEKTMAATKEVGETIRGIQSGTKRNQENVELAVANIGQATTLAVKSGEALTQIVRLVDASTDQIRSIAAASEQQSSASEEINHSIEDINRISRETAEAMRHSAQAVGDMAGQATVLRSLVERMMRPGERAA